MFLFRPLVLALTSLGALAAAAESERIVDVLAWPISASIPQTLAKVTFTSTYASIKSYHAPSVSEGDDIVRIGFYHANGQWSGVATAASNLVADTPKTLVLHVKSDGELYHVGFRATDNVRQSAGATNDGPLAVEVVQARPGPLLHLNKPVVVDADGKLEEKEPEKSLFQKYWWVLPAFLLLQVVMGGGGGGK